MLSMYHFEDDLVLQVKSTFEQEIMLTAATFYTLLPGKSILNEEAWVSFSFLPSSSLLFPVGVQIHQMHAIACYQIWCRRYVA